MQAVFPGEILARRVLRQGAEVRDDRVDLFGRERQALVEMALGTDGDDRRHGGEVELRMVLHAPEALAVLLDRHRLDAAHGVGGQELGARRQRVDLVLVAAERVEGVLLALVQRMAPAGVGRRRCAAPRRSRGRPD